jgi:hypothetical protein
MKFDVSAETTTAFLKLKFKHAQAFVLFYKKVLPPMQIKSYVSEQVKTT